MKLRLQRMFSVFILSVATSAALALPSFATGTVFGDACDLPRNRNNPVCEQVSTGPAATNNFIQDIISTLLFAVAVIAVIMIIVGGIRYVTSDGDSGRIKSAKDTILYAVIGLVVALLSYAIVNFVIFRFS